MFSLKAPIHPAKLTMKTTNPMMRSRKPMLKMTSKIVLSLNASPLDHLSMMAYIPTPISNKPINQKMKLKKNMVYLTHPDM